MDIPISNYKSICKFINSISLELDLEYRLKPNQIAMMKFRPYNARPLPTHEHISVLGSEVCKYFKSKYNLEFNKGSWLQEKLKS
jgi:hypothetical protein